MPIFIKHTYIFFSHTSTVATKNLCYSYRVCSHSPWLLSQSMPALLSYTRSHKCAGEPTPEITPGASSQKPDQFQPAASQINTGCSPPLEMPFPFSQTDQQQNPVWLGRSHPHLGRCCWTKCCCLRLHKIPVFWRRRAMQGSCTG